MVCVAVGIAWPVVRYGATEERRPGRRRRQQREHRCAFARLGRGARTTGTVCSLGDLPTPAPRPRSRHRLTERSRHWLLCISLAGTELRRDASRYRARRPVSGRSGGRTERRMPVRGSPAARSSGVTWAAMASTTVLVMALPGRRRAGGRLLHIGGPRTSLLGPRPSRRTEQPWPTLGRGEPAGRTSRNGSMPGPQFRQKCRVKTPSVSQGVALLCYARTEQTPFPVSDRASCTPLAVMSTIAATKNDEPSGDAGSRNTQYNGLAERPRAALTTP